MIRDRSYRSKGMQLPYRYIMIGKNDSENATKSFSLYFADNGEYINTYFSLKTAENAKNRLNKLLRETAINQDIRIVRMDRSYMIVEQGIITAIHRNINNALKNLATKHESYEG